MVDYAQAFQEGRDAARNAEVARREIEQTLKDLNAQLSMETGERIEVFQGIYTTDDIHCDSSSSSCYVGSSGEGEWRESHPALFAKNPKTESGSVELAEFRVDEKRGYPVTLDWGAARYDCEDRQALQECLYDMLRDPTVARKIEKLMAASAATP